MYYVHVFKYFILTTCALPGIEPKIVAVLYRKSAVLYHLCYFAS